mgnify:CR=1 FL=1
MADLTPGAVVANMAKLSQQLEELTDRLDGAERAAVNAKLDYERAYELAFLAADGPQYLREVIAKNAAHDQRRVVEHALREVRSIKAHITTVGTRIDVGRSAWSALRAEMNLT